MRYEHRYHRSLSAQYRSYIKAYPQGFMRNPMTLTKDTDFEAAQSLDLNIVSDLNDFAAHILRLYLSSKTFRQSPPPIIDERDLLSDAFTSDPDNYKALHLKEMPHLIINTGRRMGQHKLLPGVVYEMVYDRSLDSRLTTWILRSQPLTSKSPEYSPDLKRILSGFTPVTVTSVVHSQRLEDFLSTYLDHCNETPELTLVGAR